MKRFFFVMLICAIFINGLFGCKSESNYTDNSDIIYDAFAGCLVNEGRLYYDYEKSLLTFFDFSVDKKIPVCARPNCSHNGEDCSAYFNSVPSGYAFYEDKLYLFLPESDRTNSTTLFVSDKDGSNRRKIITIPRVVNSSKIFFSDNRVVFSTDTQENAPDISAAYSIIFTYNISSIDLSSEKESILLEDYKTKYGSISLMNYYNGNIYYMRSALKPGLDEAEYDMTNSRSDDFVMSYFERDISTGKQREILPSDNFAADYRGRYIAYCIKNDSGSQTFITDLETGLSEMVMEFDNLRGVRLLDNKLFYGEDTEHREIIKQMYYDLDTKEIKEVASSFPDTSQMTITEEVGDKFFGYITRYKDDYTAQTGNLMYMYIHKKDYYNGMKNHVEISDMG